MCLNNSHCSYFNNCSQNISRVLLKTFRENVVYVHLTTKTTIIALIFAVLSRMYSFQLTKAIEISYCSFDFNESSDLRSGSRPLNEKDCEFLSSFN